MNNKLVYYFVKYKTAIQRECVNSTDNPNLITLGLERCIMYHILHYLYFSIGNNQQSGWDPVNVFEPQKLLYSRTPIVQTPISS